ncbi:MAG: hypothetical protein KF819_35935 [Labilithrix sp.]|nr:hypothetical protein [Labilithrix sp.]
MKSWGFAAMTGLVLLALRAPSAAAAPPNAHVDALQAEAREADAAGDYDRACPIYEEIATLDPSAAALLALAQCEERWGKPESAAEHTRLASELALAPRRETTPRHEATPAPPDRVGLSVPVALSGGVGALGLMMGLVGGGLAMSAKSDIDAHCSGLACDGEGKRAADRGQAFAAVSTVGFVLAALGIGAVVFFVVRDDGASATTRGVRLDASGFGGRF